MPAAPYFHGDEELFEHRGVLLARQHVRGSYRGDKRNMETVKVLTLDKRYCLGYWLDGRGFRAGTCWRTSKGDVVPRESLNELITRCRQVFGGNARYRLGAVAEDR